MNTKIHEILQTIYRNGGHPYIVGGWVRDRIMRIESKDIDIEIFNLPLNALKEILEGFGKVDSVGISFGVLKVHGIDADFSLPRRENKNGTGHRGFIVEPDENMTLAEAASRRDFTINSTMYDPIRDEYIDPFFGIEDIDGRILRHTSEHFSEDPLRVLRGMQFCGRFGLTPVPSTINLCKTLKGEYSYLAKERVWGEWEKWATRSINPWLGIAFLYNTGWSDLYPEIAKLDYIPQDKRYHPEGNVLTHTLMTCSQMASMVRHEDNITKIVLMFAALLHDIGKRDSTEIDENGIRSPEHASVGADMAENFLNNIGCSPDIVIKVKNLIREHMAYLNIHSKKSIRRLARRLYPATIEELAKLIEADHRGRDVDYECPEGLSRMTEIAIEDAIMDDQPKPILMGRHLLELGYNPGTEIGNILREAYNMQLDGDINSLDDAISWIKENRI